MKKKSLILTVLVILTAATAVLAVVHLRTREQVPEGALMVTYRGKSEMIDLDRLTMTEISGTLVNGKGEEKTISEQGVPVADVLLAAGIDPAVISGVTVTAEDEFSAELSAEEVLEEGKAFFAEDGEDGVTLIVFGDSNAKRNVRNAVRIAVQ